MTLHQGRLPKPYKIGAIRPLTREDLPTLHDKRLEPIVQRLRDPHHRVARLLAAGHRPAEVAEACGFSTIRVYNLQADPTFQNLVAEYRIDVRAAFVDAQAESFTAHNRVRMKALRHIEERFDRADEDNDLVPVRDALAVFSDTSDRVGIQKKSTQFNMNLDFAAKLEATIARSGVVINHSPSSTVPIDSSPIRRRSFA